MRDRELDYDGWMNGHLITSLERSYARLSEENGEMQRSSANFPQRDCGAGVYLPSASFMKPLRHEVALQCLRLFELQGHPIPFDR